MIERQTIFAEEKNKEEKPHLQAFLKERSTSNKNSQNLQYAKQKLIQL